VQKVRGPRQPSPHPMQGVRKAGESGRLAARTDPAGKRGKCRRVRYNGGMSRAKKRFDAVEMMLSIRGRLIVVVHVERVGGIRIISAREATAIERKAYEGGDYEKRQKHSRNS
jgi:hypothetical protein